MPAPTKPTLTERISAATYDPALWLSERRGMHKRRRTLLAAARGTVLEIGAGTGLNLALYPDGLDRLVLVEPMAGMAARLRKRVAEVRPETEVVEASAEALPFADGSFDTVVSTLVLCTVPDAPAVVAEIARVLRPGGSFLFLEHVRSGNPRIARWQDRLEKPWAAAAEGCRCNRDTEATIRSCFTLDESADERWKGMPPIVKPLTVGRGTPASA